MKFARPRRNFRQGTAPRRRWKRPTTARCWDRARFLELRDELSREWQPRNGIERQLIDTMAQAQTSYLNWLETLEARAGLETMNRRRLQEEGRWQAPRQSDADALDQAAAMADRFNRIFLRTLRALRDLRRYAPVVVVQIAGQADHWGRASQSTVITKASALGRSDVFGCWRLGIMLHY